MSKDSPLFLTRSQVDRPHDAGLRRHGGPAGFRESGLVDSALASAQNAFFYGRGDVFDVAAAYALHLAEAQALFDGNKRLAAAAALVFLELNGIARLPNDHDPYAAMTQIDGKQPTQSGLAELFRKRAESND